MDFSLPVKVAYCLLYDFAGSILHIRSLDIFRRTINACSPSCFRNVKIDFFKSLAFNWIVFLVC